MERETITYGGKDYHRYPNSTRPQHRNYYWKHDRNNAAPVSLHRQIYEDTYGEIPPNHVVHHRDGNYLNNAIENLECITQAEHLRLHPMSEEEKAVRRIREKELDKLGEWRKRNPEAAHDAAVSRGKKSTALADWRKNNPELAKQSAIDAGRKSAEARKQNKEKRKSLQHNGSGLP